MRKNTEHKLNNQVRFPKVRVIGDGNGEIMSSYDAFQLAKSQDKDLILISEKADPPVVKIEEYSKFIYDQKQHEKKMKKNQKRVELKELKLSVNIAEHDLMVKAKKGEEFLKKGNKIKCTLMMKGRQNQNKQQGEVVMLKFADILSDIGVPEHLPKLQGNKWQMTLKPKQ